MESESAHGAEVQVAARHFILGTAGHIDHGKTSLVRALTGIDTDRLPEERRRGMTIELGFANLTVGDTLFGVVDVPGHEKFVRTMVAGATGIDIALLVVAADDSVMPQTVEHVEILHLLGIQHGVVALTKIDAVAADMVDLVREDIRELLHGTPLADAPICPVSSITGAGIDKLKRTILEVSRRVQTPQRRRPFRMAVDRVFTVPGRGTVVTGSVFRGMVEAGDELELFPSAMRVRVRGLQSHGAASPVIERGQRAAINLVGVERETIQRGSELATPGYLTPTRMIDLRLTCLSSSDRPLKSARVVRLSLGTTDLAARVVHWNRGELPVGATGYAQLRCGTEITATYGQRFILRDETALRTIGGGVILRPAARRKRAESELELAALRQLDSGSAEERVEAVLHGAGFTALTDLQLVARSGVELEELPGVFGRLRDRGRRVVLPGTERWVVPASIDDVGRRLARWLERHHQAHPELPGRSVDAVLGSLARLSGKDFARPLLDRFLKEKVFKQLGQFVCLPAFAPSLSSADEKLLHAMIAEIKQGGFQPPMLDGLAIAAQADKKRWERLATLAVALGELVLMEPRMYLHAESERKLREVVAEHIRSKGPQTVAEIREALQSSRKYVVPFVEYLDRVGFTRRIGDRRALME